jgi:hypothetical protein
MSRHKAALLTEYDRGTQAALPFPPTATTATAASAVDEAMGGTILNALDVIADAARSTGYREEAISVARRPS